MNPNAYLWILIKVSAIGEVVKKRTELTTETAVNIMYKSTLMRQHVSYSVIIQSKKYKYFRANANRMKY